MRNASALILSVVAVLTFSLQSHGQDDDIVKVDTSIVVVNVTVADRSGRAVSALKRPEFTVLEDGVKQDIVDFLAEETPFAAVILIDTSGSMESRVSLARSAAITFLKGLRSNDVAAVYNFDSKIELVQDFSSTTDLSDRAFELRSKGMTVLNDAVLRAASALSNRPERRRAIIVLSDGYDTLSSTSFDKALKAASDANANIYTVDMSPQPEYDAAERTAEAVRRRNQTQGVLKKFAERTGGLFVATPGGQAMRDSFRQFVEELGQQYTLTYTPTNTKLDGKFRSIEVRVARPELMIRTRKGYNAPRPERSR